MKLTQHENKDIVVSKTYGDLLELSLTHKVASTTGIAGYMGPAISRDAWNEVLSFFIWTNTHHHSESQVRAYVNTKKKEWAFWAFPQEARSGMSAHEIMGKDFDEQRAMFSDTDGWTYFGTVHHHCNATAFQSGTDQSNEKNQDGLHITMGRMQENRLDMHARFYLSGALFTPDMSEFWDIGEQLKEMTPPESRDAIARYQMTSPPKSPSFPKAWEKNLIEIKTYAPGYGGYMKGYSPNVSSTVRAPWEWSEKGKKGKKNKAVEPTTLADRADAALEDWAEDVQYMSVDLYEMYEFCKLHWNNAISKGFDSACKRYNVDADDLMKAIMRTAQSYGKGAKQLPASSASSNDLRLDGNGNVVSADDSTTWCGD